MSDPFQIIDQAHLSPDGEQYTHLMPVTPFDKWQHLVDLFNGHGLLCLFWCRYPYWHGRNYRAIRDVTGGLFDGVKDLLQ